MIEVSLDGVTMRFATAPRLFSPAAADRGTLAMLSCVKLGPGDKVLDLGCGYGLVGIYASKIVGAERVWMVDNDRTAIAYAKQNAAENGVMRANIVASDGFRDLTESAFTKILCNPPYHADFSVPKHFIEKGFNRLTLDGRMYFVTKRRTWYENKLRSVFGGVRVRELDSYVMFEAVKKSFTYASKESRRA